MNIKNIFYLIILSSLNAIDNLNEKRETLKKILTEIINGIKELTENKIIEKLPKQYDFFARAGRYNKFQRLFFVFSQEKNVNQIKDLKEFFYKENIYEGGPFNAFYFFEKRADQDNYESVIIIDRKEVDTEFLQNSKFIEDKNLAENGNDEEKTCQFVSYEIAGEIMIFGINSEQEEFNELLKNEALKK